MSDNSHKQTYSWKSPLNIWTWGYHWNWKYPSTWWDCIKQFLRNLRFAWQRTVRGYCDKDVWDLDEYYSNLFYSSLNNLADTTHSYPGRGQFSTPEAWDKYLREIAEHFKYTSSAYEDECYPKVSQVFNRYIKTDNEDDYKAWIAEERQKDGERTYHQICGFDMIKKVFFDLWD